MNENENPVVNSALLAETLAQIVDHPSKWHQGAWRCGTGMCFAGWAATLDGVEWCDSNPEGRWPEYVYDENGTHFWDPENRTPVKDDLKKRLADTSRCFEQGREVVWSLRSLELSITSYQEATRKAWRRCMPVDRRAQTILGLTENEANRLFRGENTVSDLIHAIAKIERGDIRRRSPFA